MDRKVKTQVKNVCISPQKLRLVADLVREMNAQKAMDILSLTTKKGALYVKKALESAVTAGKSQYNVEPSDMKISKLTIDEGRKRRKPRYGSRGRVSMLVKKFSHINLEIEVK